MPRISKNKCCDCQNVFIVYGAKRCRPCLTKSVEYKEKMSKVMKGKDPVNRKSLYTSELNKKRALASFG